MSGPKVAQIAKKLALAHLQHVVKHLCNDILKLLDNKARIVLSNNALMGQFKLGTKLPEASILVTK